MYRYTHTHIYIILYTLCIYYIYISADHIHRSYPQIFPMKSAARGFFAGLGQPSCSGAESLGTAIRNAGQGRGQVRWSSAVEGG